MSLRGQRERAGVHEDVARVVQQLHRLRQVVQPVQVSVPAQKLRLRRELRGVQVVQVALGAGEAGVGVGVAVGVGHGVGIHDVGVVHARAIGIGVGGGGVGLAVGVIGVRVGKVVHRAEAPLLWGENASSERY